MNAGVVTVSIEVAADPHTAFRVFTADIDTWWLRGPKHRFRARGNGRLELEPGVTGRLFERYDDGSVFEIGRVLKWEPGERVVMSWRLPNFAAAEATEVEVRFEPVGEATRVSVEHRGWHALRGDHPARHGLSGREFEMSKARLWGENLAAFRSWIHHDAARPNP
jgi:uncharacterized protein YndB with AHSA1/START domain